MHARSVLVRALVGLLLAGVTTEAYAQCDPSMGCCVADCGEIVGLPTAADCVDDSCACAQQIHCYIAQNEVDWDLYPGSFEFEPTTRPVHGRYLTIRLNPTAQAGLEANAPGVPGPVEMPDGAVLVKENYPPDPSEPGVPSLDPSIVSITSMIKLDGYCPETSGATSQCVGGDWYFLLRVGDSFPLAGKPSGCTNCHAAAVRGDWLWRLFSARRYGQP